ncbi:MAG: nucleotide exchange factor GrpE [Frankia sp.]|nr:nucleotide exchange factor GrpE [Frankia sp.]
MGGSAPDAAGTPGADPDTDPVDSATSPQPFARQPDTPSTEHGPSTGPDGFPLADLSTSEQGAGAGQGDGTEQAPAAAFPVTAELVEALRRVERQAAAFHTRAQSYEHIVQQMQSRIEKLQGDQVQTLLRPLIQRIATLHAAAVAAAEQARERGEKAENDLSYFARAIEEALGLLDIESVEAAPSVRFDPKRHHATRVVPTNDPAMDGLIARVLRQGFTYADAERVLLPAQVSIYRYEPPAAAEATSAEHDAGPADERGEGASGD